VWCDGGPTAITAVAAFELDRSTSPNYIRALWTDLRPYPD